MASGRKWKGKRGSKRGRSKERHYRRLRTLYTADLRRSIDEEQKARERYDGEPTGIRCVEDGVPT